MQTTLKSLKSFHPQKIVTTTLWHSPRCLSLCIVYIQYSDKNIGGQILVSYFTVLKNEKRSYKRRSEITTFPRYRPLPLMANFLETFDTIKESLQ